MAAVSGPQCVGLAGNPREHIFQYYYPKFAPAAERHGDGVGQREIVWAQDQHFKLYRDGNMFAVTDRYEEHPISSDKAADARRKLQIAIDSMPSTAPKLVPYKPNNKP